MSFSSVLHIAATYKVFHGSDSLCSVFHFERPDVISVLKNSIEYSFVSYITPFRGLEQKPCSITILWTVLCGEVIRGVDDMYYN